MYADFESFSIFFISSYYFIYNTFLPLLFKIITLLKHLLGFNLAFFSCFKVDRELSTFYNKAFGVLTCYVDYLYLTYYVFDFIKTFIKFLIVCNYFNLLPFLLIYARVRQTAKQTFQARNVFFS